jgi:hypothetical protein
MKKLLLLCVLFISLSGYTQHYNKTQLKSRCEIVADYFIDSLDGHYNKSLYTSVTGYSIQITPYLFNDLDFVKNNVIKTFYGIGFRKIIPWTIDYSDNTVTTAYSYDTYIYIFMYDLDDRTLWITVINE